MKDNAAEGKSPAIALAVTWEEHRRTRELCEWLGLPLHELTFNAQRLHRYAKLSRRTLRLLSQRPAVVYVQNPSLMLSLLTLGASTFFGGFRVVVDAHNEAVAPFAHAYWPVTALSRFALRAADITIVTNAALAEQVRAIGGHPIVLPDRLPKTPFVAHSPLPLASPFEVMVVATYAADEPITEIIEAGRLLGGKYQFSITGRETKLPEAQRSRLPSNVKQTGFLSEEEYWGLMRRSHLVLDLTLKPNCLVCGAYEALAMCRPMVLTGNPATVDLFGEVAIFPADHTPASIAHAIQTANGRYSELSEAVRRYSRSFPERWEEKARELQATIERWLDESAQLDASSSGAKRRRAAR